jgi:hypothetical protein
MDFHTFLVSALLGATALAACYDDEKPCDPDQVYENRVCKDKPAEPIDSGGGSGGGGDEDASTDTAPPDVQEVPPNWGEPCSMPGDAAVNCRGASNYCVARPGSIDGYCSAIDCVGKTGLCPMGWMCFEIGTIANWCAKP